MRVDGSRNLSTPRRADVEQIEYINPFRRADATATDQHRWGGAR